MSTLSQFETNDLLRVVDVTTSTNDDAREAAREGAPHGSAVAAHAQTAGRGRRGHVWESPRGSLYLSCVLRPSVPMHFFTGLPAVCALGVLDCLRDDLGIAQAALKWPNDIIAGPSKLAGILVEAGSSAMGTFAVCGVELVEDPSKLPSFDDIAELLRRRIVARVDAWDLACRQGRAQAGPLAPILNEYFDCCPLLGHRVRALSPEGELVCTGYFAGLDCWGRATVRRDDGAEVVYTSEMVSLRPE